MHRHKPYEQNKLLAEKHILKDTLMRSSRLKKKENLWKGGSGFQG